MAKTESTAVNDLIKIAATQTPLRKDPSEDLMFTVPPKKDRTSKHVMTPRGTDVPLPRDRAPHGTQEHAVAMPAITISSAPASPSHSTTIPPLPRASDAALEPIATRATRPSLPPPTRAPLPPPSRSAMPSEYPIVSAVHSLPMAPALVPELEPDLEDDSFDVDVAPFHGDSTAQVAKQRTNLAWIIKLAPLAAAMIVLGVVVGYLVLDRKNDAQREVAAPGGTVEVKVVAEPASETPVAVAAVTPENLAAPAEPAAAITPPDLAAAEPTAGVASATEPATTPTAAAASTTTETATAPSQSVVAAATAPSPTAVAPAPAIATTVATPSITTPAPIAGRPVFVDVRIDSKPAGATVMLVDRGKQTFLGTTPISTAVDPSRTYDVVFSHPRRKTQVEPLDPKATNRLAVELGKPGNRAKPEIAKPAVVAPAPKPVTVKAPVAKLAKPAKIIEPSWDTQIEKAAKPEKPAAKIETTEPAKAETAPVAKAEKAVGGNGVLMISSKPPCEIHIDGKSTGLRTPQRALPLSAGKHKITLVNPAQKIKKSFAVEIKADEPTKVIQDLTALMK